MREGPLRRFTCSIFVEFLRTKRFSCSKFLIALDANMGDCEILWTWLLQKVGL